MTALDKYRVRMKGCPGNYKQAADAAIRSLKVCGSCADFYVCESEYRIDAGSHECVFTPRKWQERAS